MIIRIWIPIWIKDGEIPCPKSHPQCRKWNATIVEKPFAYTLCIYIYIYMHVHCHFITASLLVKCLCSTVQSTADMNMEKKTKTQCTSHIEWLNTRNYPDLAFLALIFDPYPHGYGSIPIKIQFSGGWTSINPSCFWTDRGLPWPMAIIREGIAEHLVVMEMQFLTDEQKRAIAFLGSGLDLSIKHGDCLWMLWE